MERVKTGIPGLDELIQGGFPKNSSILVTGGPGTGKTIFSFQFLVKGAKEYDEPGIYFSLEEEPERLIHNLAPFSWPVKELIKNEKLSIVKTELYNFEKLKGMIEDEVERVSASRIAIDPSTVIGMFFERELDVRRSMLELDKLLKRLNCTSLLVCEVPEGKNALSAFGVEEFTADGIILLKIVSGEGFFTRTLAVRKMRATKHDMNEHPFEITKDGIKIYPEEKVF